jgi:hypothetical protein
MKKHILGLAYLVVIHALSFSCSNETEENNAIIKHGNGTLWLSGGLMFCATQIRMENGDTLIPINELQVLKYNSGQKLEISYELLETKETGCSIGKDCKIETVVLVE